MSSATWGPATVIIRKPRVTTFRSRLTVSVTLLSFGILVFAGLIVYLGAREVLRVNLDSALLAIARSEVASAIDGPNGKVHIHESGPGSGGYEKFSQIEDASGRVVARTRNLYRAPAWERSATHEKTARQGHINYGDLSLGKQPLRCIFYPFTDPQGRSYLAVVGVSELPMRRSLQSLAGLVFVSLLVGAGLAAAASRRLAVRLTRPLREVASAARSIDAAQLSTRIPEVSTDAELRDVTAILNDMLARLEDSFSKQQSLVASQRRFAADASHELRSPLSNLRGTIEVALRRPRRDDEYREALEASLAEVQRMSRIVADLLTLSRADSGQMPLNVADCDLTVIAASAVNAASGRAAESGVVLTLAASPEVRARCDADRLREVLDNLIDNAIRYSASGVAVTVAAWMENDAACIRVTDTGRGIPEEDQARIFDRFYRLDPARARHSGGTGLGLAIAKATVEAHGGSVSLHSIIGTGATFTITLPAAGPSA